MIHRYFAPEPSRQLLCCCHTCHVSNLEGERQSGRSVLAPYPKLEMSGRTMLARHDPEAMLDTVLNALSSDTEWRSVLDELPTPVYMTDVDGAATYWNRACAEFAGREPPLGRDRWCVTWKIFTTTGDVMPHDRGPMADAIRQQRIVP